MPLAVSPNTIYTQKSVSVGRGDRFIMYTDGLTEAFNSENEVYGLDRLKSFINKNADLSPASLKERITEEVRQYAGGSLDHDDVTIMIAEIG